MDVYFLKMDCPNKKDIALMKISQLLLVSLSFMAMACSRHLDTVHAPCNLEKHYPVEYLGTAFGKGSISFSKFDERTNTIGYEITVAPPGASTPDIAIRGVAQCLSGVVTGTFGSGVTSKPELSVLGGKFEGLFVNSHIDRPFGRWQVSLYDAKKDRDYRLSGYWQQIATIGGKTSALAVKE